MKRKALVVLLVATLGASILWRCGKGSDARASAPSASTTVGNTDSSTTSGADSGIQLPNLTGYALMIYCGAGMTKPFQEIAGAPKSHTGCETNVTYANMGWTQSQTITSEEGNLFVVGSGDESKPVESYVEGKKEPVKHMSILVVRSGDPKNITRLADLTRDGVALIMGGVNSTPIGKIAKEAMTDAGIFDRVQIGAITATAPQMSIAPTTKEADAAIVWRENCDAQDVGIVNTTDLDPYIKTIPAVSLNCAAGKDALEAFDQYLDMGTVKKIWMKYGYEIAE